MSPADRCVIAFVALCGVGAFAAELSGASAEDRLAPARAALARGDWPKAVELLRPVIAEGGAPADRAAAFALWGEIELLGGDPEAAIATWEKAHALAPSAGLAESLADAALSVGDPKAALRWLEAAKVQTDGGTILRAIARLALGERDRAERELTAVTGPAAGMAAHYLGVIAFERGESETALVHFDRAATGGPDDYYAVIYRARALLDLHRIAAAERELTRIESVRASAEVAYLRGLSALRARRPGEAVRHFRAALERRENYPEALYGLATALKKAGETASARSAFERFRAARTKESKLRGRVEMLEQKVTRTPKELAPRLELLQLTRELGDLESAERHAWTAVRLAPDSPATRLALARTLVLVGRFQRASVQYQRILTAQPSHRAAREELDRLVREHARGATP